MAPRSALGPHRRSWPACATSSSARSAELGQSTSLSHGATTAATHADHSPPSASAFDETDITQDRRSRDRAGASLGGGGGASRPGGPGRRRPPPGPASPPSS